MMTLDEWSTCDVAWYAFDVGELLTVPVRFSPGPIDCELRIDKPRRLDTGNRWWGYNGGKWWFATEAEAIFAMEVLL